MRHKQIVFVVGTPKAQPRARAGKSGFYTPLTARDWKSSIAYHVSHSTLIELLPELPRDTPFWVSAEYRFHRPKSHHGTGRNADKLKPSAPRYHTQKPDRDNLDKAVLDAFTDIGLWHDDCQVVGGQIQKRWCEPHEGPGCEITIEWEQGDDE